MAHNTKSMPFNIISQSCLREGRLNNFNPSDPNKPKGSCAPHEVDTLEDHQAGVSEEQGILSLLLRRSHTLDHTTVARDDHAGILDLL